jgi:hypothetical protein
MDCPTTQYSAVYRIKMASCGLALKTALAVSMAILLKSIETMPMTAEV